MIKMIHNFNLFKWINIIWVCICIIFASIQPLDMHSYLLHQVGTVLMIIVLFYFNAKIYISNLSFFCYCFGFLSLHILAAHYLYSFVPYNEWLIQYLHVDLNAYFGWQRNMFDRLVHFAYGFLLYPIFYQIFYAYFKPLSQKHLLFLVIMWVMASSMVYELIEWGIAIGLSPEEAEAYNGQQGDVWDAHKDMFLASVGSVIMMLIYPFFNDQIRSNNLHT